MIVFQSPSIFHLTNYNSSAKPTMQVKESHLDDEFFETLSLSDLPLYSDDHDHLQRGEYDEISQNEEDFEFSSQELTSSLNTVTTTASSFPQDNIVFCGKLIGDGNKQPSLPREQYTTPPLIEHQDHANKTKKRAWGLFRWNFSLRRTATKRQVQLLPKNGAKSNNALMRKSSKIQVSKSQKKKLEIEHYDKVSILTSSSSGKAKWYLFLFGMSSFSTKIELQDMKNRLQRISSGRSPSRISPTFGFRDYIEEENAACKERIDRGWGLLELIKTLNCGRN